MRKIFYPVFLLVLSCSYSNAQISYCSPTFLNGCWSWNNQAITLNTLNWSSGGGSCSLYDFTNLSTTLIAGQTYPMSVTNGNWCGCAVWVDFDSSGTFDPSENLYYLYNAQAIQTYNFNITIPGLTLPGIYRMRVIAPWGSDGFNVGPNGYGGCGSYQYGNFNDFTVIIQNQCPATTDSVMVSACDQYVSPSGHSTWTNPGFYWDTIPNAAGCDSLIHIELSLGFSSSNTIFPSACGEYFAPSGAYYNQSGTYLDTIPNAAGCDSVIRIDLSILEPSFDSIFPVACNQYLSPGGNTYSLSGSYQDTIQNSAGCDSIIYIELLVNAGSSDTLHPVSCGTYVSDAGNAYSQSGTFTETFTNAAGCDSFIVLQLTVIQLDTTVSLTGGTLHSNMNGSSYQWLDCESGMSAIPGATQQNFSPSVSGFYAVALSQNSCSDTTACFQVTLNVGADISQYNSIQVYPNPGTGSFRISGLAGREGEVKVYNLLGEMVYESNELNAEILLESHYPCVYMMEIRTTGILLSRMVVVE